MFYFFVVFCLYFFFVIELILYLKTLVKIFIRYRISVVEILGSLIYAIQSSANCYAFDFSFPICIPLTYFNCHVELKLRLQVLG